MTDYSEQVAAVLFTINVARLATFYEHVIGMERRAAHDDHVVLEQGVFRLTVHGIPAQYAKGITIATPPAVRESSALKLSFRVTSIVDARETAARFGGCIYEPDREWRDHAKTLCDGWDPDGNVFQVFTVRKD
jgi:predicted enzyme related to lactoylglutathione lyase